MFTYRIGSITIVSESINDLKEFAQELRELAKESGSDLSNKVGDACFGIETDYQTQHELDQDNWEIVH